MSTSIERPEEPSRPEGWETMTAEAQRKWAEDFQKSDEYRQYMEAIRKASDKRASFAVALASDGTFRVEDVPAGKYELQMTLFDPPTEGSCGFGQPRGAVSTEVVVPEIPGGQSDEPLDLGKINVGIRKVLAVGQTAPDLEVKDLAGRTMRLADFRGKFVLLDFWATWCGPCLGETPHLKAVYEALGQDERFVMIGLSLDPNASDANGYVQKNGMGWRQGHLGDWSKTNVPKQFGVDGIPSIFLIGPDGRIIAQGLRGDRIRSAAESALRGGPRGGAASQPATAAASR